MKVFTKEKFIELLKTNGWEHYEYIVDNGKYSLGEGKVGTRSLFKYGNTRLQLLITADWFDTIVFKNSIEYKKNFIVYSVEDECVLEDILSFEEKNGFDEFVNIYQELLEYTAKEHTENYKRRQRNQIKYALEQEEKLKQSLKP